MKDNFKINEKLLEDSRESMEEMEELHKKVLTEAATQQERALTAALYNGHDFVDEKIKSDGQVEYIGWDEGHEPKYDFLDRYCERFDLRDITFQDLKNRHRLRVEQENEQPTGSPSDG